jgi:hypothetical protein
MFRTSDSAPLVMVKFRDASRRSLLISITTPPLTSDKAEAVVIKWPPARLFVI